MIICSDAHFATKKSKINCENSKFCQVSSVDRSLNRVLDS